MNLSKSRASRIVAFAALLAASALALGACASPPREDNPGVLYYMDTPARGQQPAAASMLMDPQDRSGGGAGGGGGGGGGH
jgi:hypothetical protein